MRRALFKHASQNLATQLAVAVTAVVGSIIISRALGPSETGEYSFATFTSLTIVSLLTLGLPTALVRHVAEADAVGDHQRTSQIIAESMRFSVRVGLVATAVGSFVSPRLP